ncbi:MAG TPA: MraY family glycosyltransferase [Thermoleophilia bacterium]|nr:MraY family glycosyltransferase [Thermoleophilia bacterium]
MARLARRTGVVDRPSDPRRMHARVTPLLGGVAIYLGVMIPTLILVHKVPATMTIIVGGTIIAAVGVVDDYAEIRPLFKFAGQLGAIAVLLAYGLRIDHLSLPLTDVTVTLVPAISIPLTVLWVATIINMVNFIDGLDGLAAGVCAISALTFAVIALSFSRGPTGVVAAVLAGAAFAFLRFNFYPASIFMGDAGSMLLGFVLATISIHGVLKTTAGVALIFPLLVLGVPFADLFLVVFRRLRKGVPIYTSGRDHVHHDLVLVAGFSQRTSVLLLYGWCLLLNGLALAMRFSATLAIVVLGVAAAAATAFMARLLLRYRARDRRLGRVDEALGEVALSEAPPPARRPRGGRSAGA